MRGIADYLINNFGDKYKCYLVRKRLLTYTEVLEVPYNYNSEINIDRFKAVSSFVNLLQKTDNHSKNKILDILRILETDN